MKNFEKYSQENIQFHSHIIPSLLKKILYKIVPIDELRIIDIGCGDGVLLSAMKERGFLSRISAVGIDLSLIRLKRLKDLQTHCNLIRGDASHLDFFKPESFNLAISTQVIEHLTDEDAFLSGIRSLLKPESYLYLSTVIKGKNAFWIYRNNGHIVLDPTHIHEFNSKDELLSLLEKHGFSPCHIQVYPVKFGIIECIIRTFIFLGIKADSTELYFLNHPRIAQLNKIGIPVPGYSIIEGLFRRVN